MLIQIKCHRCSKSFQRQKCRIERSKKHFCSNDCAKLYRKENASSKILVECLNCYKSFLKLRSEIKKFPNNFCSQKCSAIFNNTKYPKRVKTFTNFCNICSIPLNDKKTNLCKTCYDKEHIPTNSLTLETIKITKSFSCNHFSRVRYHARKIAQKHNLLLKCALCDYTLHIDACHIKSISSFPPKTLISEINDISNLIGLCKNHHWEFDHGHISLEHISQIKNSL